MAHEVELLRMLEPAVRPTGAPSRTAAPARPIEQLEFDALLRRAGNHADAAPPDDELSEPKTVGLLRHLGQFGNIASASLRNTLEHANAE